MFDAAQEAPGSREYQDGDAFVEAVSHGGGGQRAGAEEYHLADLEGRHVQERFRVGAERRENKAPATQAKQGALLLDVERAQMRIGLGSIPGRRRRGWFRRWGRKRRPTYHSFVGRLVGGWFRRRKRRIRGVPGGFVAGSVAAVAGKLETGCAGTFIVPDLKARGWGRR